MINKSITLLLFLLVCKSCKTDQIQRDNEPQTVIINEAQTVYCAKNQTTKATLLANSLHVCNQITTFAAIKRSDCSYNLLIKFEIKNIKLSAYLTRLGKIREKGEKKEEFCTIKIKL